MGDDTSRPCYTIHDRSGLKLPKTVSDKDINAAELLSCALVEEKYLGKWPSRRTAPFTSRWMFKLHAEMFGKVWRWAGKPRRSDTNIGTPWLHITTQMEELAEDLPVWRGDHLEKAAELHFRAICIHPFRDGNGRWARLMTNTWLAQNRHPIISWPEPHLRDTRSPIREEYIAAVKRAELGERDAFVALHRKFLSRSSSIS